MARRGTRRGVESKRDKRCRRCYLYHSIQKLFVKMFSFKMERAVNKQWFNLSFNITKLKKKLESKEIYESAGHSKKFCFINMAFCCVLDQL